MSQKKNHKISEDATTVNKMTIGRVFGDGTQRNHRMSRDLYECLKESNCDIIATDEPYQYHNGIDNLFKETYRATYNAFQLNIDDELDSDEYVVNLVILRGEKEHLKAVKREAEKWIHIDATWYGEKAGLEDPHLKVVC